MPGRHFTHVKLSVFAIIIEYVQVRRRFKRWSGLICPAFLRRFFFLLVKMVRGGRPRDFA
jgi:hypothetical protein